MYKNGSNVIVYKKLEKLQLQRHESDNAFPYFKPRASRHSGRRHKPTEAHLFQPFTQAPLKYADVNTTNALASD
jgi:hypothetical protein